MRVNGAFPIPPLFYYLWLKVGLNEHAPYKKGVPGTEMAVAQNNLKLKMAPQSPVLLSHFMPFNPV